MSSGIIDYGFTVPPLADGARFFLLCHLPRRELVFVRIVGQQVFIEAPGLDQLPVLIVAQLNQPAEYVLRPLGVRQNFPGSAPSASSNAGISP